MPPVYRPYIPRSLGDLLDLLGMMMISSPLFIDKTGYFPERNIDTVFQSLSDGLQNTRRRLGEERYRRLVELSKQVRAYFEADPVDKGDALKGRELILDMENLIRAAGSKS